MKILLLAGTSEARMLARDLKAAGHAVTASLAGATRQPGDMDCPTRIGGFGGNAGFAGYLADFQPNLVVDATHPFAHRISHRTARICAHTGTGYLQLLRDAWQPGSNDDWTMIDSAAQAADHIKAQDRVFLATGRQTLHQFDGIDAYFICRQIDPPDGPFPLRQGEYRIGRPPFSVEDEVGVFRSLKLDWLVVKNAGGQASRSKLDAAAQIRLRVLMIDRPAQPDGPKVATTADALDWIETYAHHQNR